jgi:peroxiredoxin
MLREGDPAPDFELAGLESEMPWRFRLQEQTAAGQAVVVFFFPLGERTDDLERRLGYAAWFWDDAPVVPCVIDTSRRVAGGLDTAPANVPWPLLLDPFGTVAQWYGLPDEGTRALFVIGSDGHVAYAWQDRESEACPVRGVVDTLLTRTPAAWPEPAT